MGLYFYNARYYDPTIGRFISADTLIQAPFDPQSLNRYSYVRNNPLRYVDPTGRCWGPFSGLPGCGTVRAVAAEAKEAVVALVTDVKEVVVTTVSQAAATGYEMDMQSGTLNLQGAQEINQATGAAITAGATEVLDAGGQLLQSGGKLILPTVDPVEHMQGDAQILMTTGEAVETFNAATVPIHDALVAAGGTAGAVLLRDPAKGAEAVELLLLGLHLYPLFADAVAEALDESASRLQAQMGEEYCIIMGTC